MSTNLRRCYFVPFLALFSSLTSTTEALYEDQAFKFDWRLQQIGVPLTATFLLESDQGDGLPYIVFASRISYGTEKGTNDILSAVEAEDGVISWRHIFPSNEKIISLLLLSETRTVSLPAGDIATLSKVENSDNSARTYFVRTWNCKDGSLVSEKCVFQNNGKSREIIISPFLIDQKIESFSEGLNLMFVSFDKSKGQILISANEDLDHKKVEFKDKNQKSSVKRIGQCTLSKARLNILCLGSSSSSDPTSQNILVSIDVKSKKVDVSKLPKTDGKMTFNNIEVVDELMEAGESNSFFVKFDNKHLYRFDVNSKWIKITDMSHDSEKDVMLTASCLNTPDFVLLKTTHPSTSFEIRKMAPLKKEVEDFSSIGKQFEMAEGWGQGVVRMWATCQRDVNGHQIFQVVILTLDGQLISLNENSMRSGKAMWIRDESLAHISDVQMVSLPQSHLYDETMLTRKQQTTMNGKSSVNMKDEQSTTVSTSPYELPDFASKNIWSRLFVRLSHHFHQLKSFYRQSCTSKHLKQAFNAQLLRSVNSFWQSSFGKLLPISSISPVTPNSLKRGRGSSGGVLHSQIASSDVAFGIAKRVVAAIHLLHHHDPASTAINSNRLIVKLVGLNSVSGMKIWQRVFQVEIPENSSLRKKNPSNYKMSTFKLFTIRHQFGSTVNGESVLTFNVEFEDGKKNALYFTIFNPFDGSLITPLESIKSEGKLSHIQLYEGAGDDSKRLPLVVFDGVHPGKILTTLGIPSESKAGVVEREHFVMRYVGDELMGFSFHFDGSSAHQPSPSPLWNIKLSRTSVGDDDAVHQGRVVGMYPASDALNPSNVHSPGRVLNDRSVLYKYLNPNLVLVIYEGSDLDLSNERGGGSGDKIYKYIDVFLVDSVSGRVIYSTHHAKVRPPYLAIHSENWCFYTYYNEKMRRTEMASIELYESKSHPHNATAFSSLLQEHQLDGGQGKGGRVRGGSNAVHEVVNVERQTFILGGPLANIASMTESKTQQSITSKFILIATKGGSIYNLPKHLIDPRRPKSQSIPPVEQRDASVMLSPYTPELILPSEFVLNYNQSCQLIRGMVTSPSEIESTSSVFIFGLDLFTTRVQPSKGFDLLKEDFDHAIITIVVGALILAAFITRKMAQRKNLLNGWS